MVELAEVIGQLRTELTAAIRAGEGADLRFELGPVDLELTVTVGKEVTPGAKVKFWVMELGADATVSSNSIQRIKLSLDPRWAGQPDRRPEVSGDSVVGER